MMTTAPVALRRDQPVRDAAKAMREQAVRRMRERAVRRVPVVADGRHSGREKPAAKFSAAAKTRYMSHRPVAKWKKPSARVPGRLSRGTSGPRLAKNSEM